MTKSTTNFPSPQKIQPSRKQITVLFCDIVDYTSRSASMDPEDLADEIWVFQTICNRIAEKHGGNICDYLGDGLMILFGHPFASEFDPENAILAAREMNEEIQNNNSQSEWRNKRPLYLRTGIATGLVLVGDRAGKHHDRNELVFGIAPALAARLQSLAKPESIVVSDTTRELSINSFRFRSLGEQQLKGFSDPVPAYEILGASHRRHASHSSINEWNLRLSAAIMNCRPWKAVFP